MNPSHRQPRGQRGEGKIGCVASLLFLAVLTAVGLKAVPVYWSDNELKDAAKDMASRASVIPVEAIELQLRGKAKELGIGAALAPGAIKASKVGDGTQGTCTIRLKYSQKIDLYGVYEWTVEVDSQVMAPYLSGA